MVRMSLLLRFRLEGRERGRGEATLGTFSQLLIYLLFSDNTPYFFFLRHTTCQGSECDRDVRILPPSLAHRLVGGSGF